MKTKNDRILIIPDLHTNVSWVEPFLASHEHTKVIFLGDYFDSHLDNDSPYAANLVAQWLAKSVCKSNRVHLLGNHDLSYMFPHNGAMYCPGFTLIKYRAICPHMTHEHWKRMHVCSLVEQNGQFLFSHAGFKNLKFNDGKLDAEWLAARCKDALTRASYDNSPFLTDVESCMWIRWDSLLVIDGINQVVGHTEYSRPQLKTGPASFNLNLDTRSRYYGLLENGTLTTHHLAS